MNFPEEIQRLHGVGALLRRFTVAQLHRLTELPTDLIAAWVATDQVDHLQNSELTFCLRTDLQTTTLATIRAERPNDEVEGHCRAFDDYVAFLAQQSPAERCVADEDECLYHLDQIFLLVGMQNDWPRIIASVAAARALNLSQLRHQERLTLYDGYAAIRTHQYDQGEFLLTRLVEQEPEDLDVLFKAIKGLADSALYRANYEQALFWYQRLHQVAQRAGDQSYQGLALLNSSVVYNELDNNLLALNYCEQSLPLFRAVQDQRREGFALYHLGLYSMYLGRWEVALEHAAEAARIFQHLQLDNYLGYVYWIQGVTNQCLGNEAESEQYYLQVLALAEVERFGQMSLTMDSQLALGSLYHMQERWEQALRCYDAAREFANQLDQRHRASLINYRMAQIYRQQGQVTTALALLATALELAEKLRSATQSEELKIDLLGTTAQIYEELVLLCLENNKIEQAFETVERARSRAFLDALAKRSPELIEAFDQPVVSLAEVQANLPNDAVLLEYFTTGVLPRSDQLVHVVPRSNRQMRAYLSQPATTWVFVIRQQQFAVHQLNLDPNAIRPPVGARIPGRHLLHGRLPEHLYNCLIAPTATAIEAARTIYIAPHGPLHSVPFAALRSPDGHFLLHARGPTLAQVPGATLLVRSCFSRPAADLSRVVAFGDNDPSGDLPLRFAEAEAAYVADYANGKVRTARSATSQNLFALAEEAGVLHIAGHAQFDSADPLGSGIRLDGRLVSSRELMRNIKTAAGLVVLSSCTSGVSQIVAGDELLGLQRALLLVGVPTIVCTRWEALDLCALLVMEHFYRALFAGATAAQALQTAQIAVRSLTRPQLQAVFREWQRSPVLAGIAAQCASLLDTLHDVQPFADPLYWATFMVVGRA